MSRIGVSGASPLTERLGKALREFGKVVRGTPSWIWFKVAFIVICCAWMLDGRHPPAEAQNSQSADIYGLQARAAVQEAIQREEASRYADHFATIDGRLAKLGDELRMDTNAISGIHGEQEMIGGVLVILQIGSMVWKRNGGKKSGSSE